MLLLLLGLLGAVAVIASELAWPLALPLAAMSLGQGAWLARRERQRPARSLVIPVNDAVATIDGEPMADLQLQWRGPLAFLQWRAPDGRLHRLQGWPDNLDATARRELRLAVAARVPARASRSMAP